MAWRRPGAKPLSEPMMVSLLTHICVTRPQWVKPYEWIAARNIPSLQALHYILSARTIQVLKLQ